MADRLAEIRERAKAAKRLTDKLYCNELSHYQCETLDESLDDIPFLLGEAERLAAALEAAERRAEAAINTIFQYSGCCECACFDGNEYPGWCTKHDRETSCSDQCDVPEWSGPSAENGGEDE